MIKELKLYFVKVDKTSQMILKIYPSDYKVEGDKYQLIIIITNNECIFLFNDNPYFK